MLERLFTSQARIKLLSFLLFHQEEQFHLRGLARMLSISPIQASQELDNLERAGIVNKTKQAHLNMYGLNTRCVFLTELRGLFLKTDLVGQAIMDLLEGKAKYCCIFGSFAKGTERAESDLDVFIVSSLPEKEILKTFRILERKLNRELNYVLWDEQTFVQRAKGNALLRTIKQEPLIMLIGDEEEFRRTIK